LLAPVASSSVSITPLSTSLLIPRMQGGKEHEARQVRGEGESAPSVVGISELVLEVSDLDGARRFYRDVLGFEETLYGEGREGRYWYLVGDAARLGLWTEQVGLAGGRGGVHVHFAFRVEDPEIDRLLERLQAETEVEGPIQLGPGRAIYVTDPDGNVVEFWSQDMSEYAAGARAGGGPGSFRSAASPSGRGHSGRPT
jgi:catechol 2,3-dioxygenase-like lactoylglutathione lyase family enzyme